MSCSASAARISRLRRRLPSSSPSTRVERRLLDAVESGLDLEAISAFTGLPVREARAELARLEPRGLVRRDGLFGWERVGRPS